MINFRQLQQNAGCLGRISAAGISIYFVDNVLHVSDEAAAQAIIDAYTLDDARAPIIMAIKALAREKILAFLPEWKQSNLNARMNELNMIRASRDWTAEESAEVATLQGTWDKAKAIRNASNVHEANLAALTTFKEISEYSITNNWPQG